MKSDQMLGSPLAKAPERAARAPRLSPRLKKTLTNFLAVAIALNVAVGLAYSVAILRRDADRHREMGSVAERIEERLAMQRSFLVAITSAPTDQREATSAVLLRGMRSLSAATEEDVARLIQISSEVEAEMTVAQQVDRHLQLVTDEIDGGDVRNGIASSLALDSERLEARLSAEGSENADHAHDAYRTADIESVFMMVLAALMAVLLQKRFVSARRSADERALLERAQGEARFRSLVQNANDVILICDAETTIKYQTPSVKAVLGFGSEELLGTQLIDLVHPNDARRLFTSSSEVAHRPGGAQTIEWRMRHQDGSWVHIESVTSNLMDDPNVEGLVLTLRDVSAQKSLEQQLRHQAFHDSLTSLANRALFSDRVGHALTRADRSQNQTSVLFVDIDDFKTINDSLGHAAGDDLLIEVARRLERSVRPSDTVARFGGDEFAILLEDVTDPTDAQEVVDRIMTGFERPFQVNDRELFVRASIGIAGSGDVEEGAEELLRNADVAMYMAKGAGKGTFAIFEPTMHVAALDRLELRAALEQSVKNKEFRLHYQPIVDLDTGEIRGVEALVRWQRGETLVPPLDFIPLAEETGLIHKLGHWVLGEACRQAKKWQKLYRIDPPLMMNVNVSARQVLQPGLVDAVRNALSDSGLDPKTLTLEITENDLVLDTEEVVERLKELKKLGIRLAIDDFGTGYSSLSYLGNFPIDVLKIDRSFMARFAEESDPGLTEAIVQLGHTLSLEIVAEGIEDSRQLEALKALECGQGQGFYFARPLEEDAIEELMERESLRPATEMVRTDET